MVDRVAIVAEVYSTVSEMHLSLLEPQSRFEDKLLGISVICPQNGSVVLKGFSKHDSGDKKALWSQTIYIYIYVLLCIVDNTGRHDIDFGREGLINDLCFFSF